MILQLYTDERITAIAGSVNSDQVDGPFWKVAKDRFKNESTVGDIGRGNIVTDVNDFNAGINALILAPQK